MENIFVWYITLFVLGIIFFPLSSRIFSCYQDTGYGVSKGLGLFIFSFISWFLCFSLNIKFSGMFLIGLLIILSFISLFFAVKWKVFNKVNFVNLVKIELIGVLLFLGVIWFRAANPRIVGIEKVMDIAIVNGLYRSEQLLPQDVWYSGKVINYYYFGHFMFALLSKVTQIHPNFGFNLFIASIFSLSANALISLMWALSRFYLHALFGSLFVLLGSNFDYFYNIVILQNKNYFYAQARSLIPYTINEFPAYSFLIGDVHAHIINLILVTLFINFLFVFLNETELSKNRMLILIMSAILAGHYATNSWDFVIYSVLTIFVILFKQSSNKEKIYFILQLIVLSAFLTFPFYSSFNPAVFGLGFTFASLPITAYFNMFGLFYLIFLGLLLTRKLKLKEPNLTFVAILAVFSVILSFFPQFVFVKDIYFKLNPLYYKANTIFKVWYQSYVLLAFSSGYVIYLVLKKSRGVQRLFYFLIIGVFLSFSFFYTYYSVKYIVGPIYKYKGLNGVEYLKEYDGDLLDTITWINKNISGQSVLLESYGKSYSMESLGSAYTGLPTVVGWSDHELGWRDNWSDIALRMGDIEKLYKSNSIEEVRRLAKKYSVRYVLIGSTERKKFGEGAGTILYSLAKVKFRAGSSVLLELAI